jgi:hypothetical protein
MAGGDEMMPAVESYLAARRAAGFKLLNADYLLRSFACFAVKRGETHVRAQTAIDWAAEAASVAQRDARLKTVCRFARYLRTEDPSHELPRPANTPATPMLAPSSSCSSLPPGDSG